MSWLALAIFLISISCAIWLCVQSVRGVWRSLGVWVAVLLAALLLLRPHGDTFTALDHSGYRLMAYSFANGRGFNDVDHTFLDVSSEFREDLTLLPYTKDRNTRDRSFRVMQDGSGATEPYFYPTLPLGAAGLQKLLPWRGMDLFPPLLGLLFAAALLAIGRREGGVAGLLLAGALFLATPLPAMLFRGFYAEVCGAVFAGLVALHWMTLPAGRPVSLAAYLALGLAPAFHPALIVVSLPLLAVLLAVDRGSARRLLSGVTLFATGPAFLLWLTANVCGPYGRLRWRTLVVNFKYSQAHQVVDVFAAVFGIALLWLLIWRLRKADAFQRALDRLHPRAPAWLLVAVLPTALALLFWAESPRVLTGLTDLWSAVRWPAAVLAIACAIPLVFSRTAGRARLVAGFAVALLPVFSYLKGAEQMAMWSQRRMGPFVLLLLPALLLPAARWVQARIGTRRAIAAGCGVLALVLGSANVARWPAPYFVRQEIGALERVQEIKANIGSRLVLFDYLPDSFPFAVDNQTRAIGWSSEGKPQHWEQLIGWLRGVASTEDVWFVASRSLPDLEEGIRFEPISTERIPVSRVHSKRALPAVLKKDERVLQFARVALIDNEIARLQQEKLLDGGPAALRPPWGPTQSLKLSDGTRVPGQWSREGSGIVGPVPRKGRVKLTVVAASNQSKPVQRLRVVPPWGEGGAVWLDVPPSVAELTAELVAPAGIELPRTGIYHFYAETPFDPQSAGHRDNYPGDLGALIHRVLFVEME